MPKSHPKCFFNSHKGYLTVTIQACAQLIVFTPKVKDLSVIFPPFCLHDSYFKGNSNGKITGKMEKIGVLLTTPMSNYLEQELAARFTLFKLWTQSCKNKFFQENSIAISAVVGDTKCGADAELIDSLPTLEIVASYSVGLDKIDLDKCKDKGVRVTNTPDVLTDDVADLAVGLVLAVLRRVCEFDEFVKSGKWKNGHFELGSKVCHLGSFVFEHWFVFSDSL